MNNYLIPANANRGKLILGFFRPIDAMIFGGGILATILLLLLFQGQMDDILVVIGVLSPVAVTGFLVIPVPHQHNILVLLTNIYKFYFVNQKKYYWRGWCSRYDEKEETSQK